MFLCSDLVKEKRRENSTSGSAKKVRIVELLLLIDTAELSSVRFAQHSLFIPLIEGGFRHKLHRAWCNFARPGFNLSFYCSWL
jgi:hypothetical protein